MGAQVSYDDRENFGRVPLDVPAGVLREQVAEQVAVLTAIAAADGGSGLPQAARREAAGLTVASCWSSTA